MKTILPDASLDQIFRTARTYYGWSDRTVEEATLRDLYDLLKWGPTSANSSPARFVWVRSQGGKEQLAALGMEKNRAKILSAPVTAIVGNDLAFADNLPKLMPVNTDAIRAALAPAPVAEATAARNGTLQGAYLIIAARAFGVDCGPMSGFDNAGVDEAFFRGTRIKSNFICSLGYGDDASLFPRMPRLAFEEAGRFA